MKTSFLKRITAFLLLLITLSLSIMAYHSKVSPALDIIASNLKMVKSGIVSGGIEFTAEDFDRSLGGTKVNSVVITSLPPSSKGTLMLNSRDVYVNQKISRSKLDQLQFIPASSNITECSFGFKGITDEAAYYLTCNMQLLNEINLAPTASLVNENNLNFSTQQGIRVFGTLMAHDPENDKVIFEIVSYPQNGILDLTDATNGTYCFTPNETFTGEDSFTYVVYDEYGNYSEEAQVDFKVTEALCDVRYDDLEEHWAHNAAIRMTATGIMTGREIGDDILFEPNLSVSRCEFLVYAMKTMGINDVPQTRNTGFMDDKNIPQEYKGYVATAFDLGIIKGVSTDQGLYFYPNNTITRSEAAVILNNMIGAQVPTVAPVFADSSDIPTWSKNALYALCDAGILQGTGGYISYSMTLTKAQTAQILSNIIEKGLNSFTK